MDHVTFSWHILYFLLAAGFIASFIDSVVGGGGLISLPALLFTGLPPTIALGTNKMASTCSSLTSTLSFLKSGKINLRIVGRLFPITLVGSACGALTVRQIPSDFLKPLVVVMLIAVALYTLFKKNWGAESTFTGMTKKTWTLAIIVAFVIGFYDGFFGPGTGSFFMFAFLMIGFDFVTAAGNAKGLNFASNIAGLLTFLCFGSVNLNYGIPMGIAMIFGAIVGSRLAIRKGTTYVRPLFLVVTTVMIGKQLWDILH